MTKLKKTISSFLAMGLIISSLQSITFAEGNITWKETIKTGTAYDDQTVMETYDPATGTFKNAENEATTRTVTNTGNGADHTYYFGTELPTEVKSGTVIVNAKFTKSSSNATTKERHMPIFGLSDKASGCTAKVPSYMSFRDNGYLGSQPGKESSGNPRWNTEVSTDTLKQNSTKSWYYINASGHELQLVASAENDTADWDIKIYDLSYSNTTHVYAYTVSRNDLPDIKYIVNSSWISASSTSTVKLVVNKFRVKAFPAELGADFSATYVPDVNDYTDRKVKINVSGRDIAYVNAVDAYIVNEETEQKNLLDSSNILYENGVTEITVPTSFYGILSIDLVLRTELKDFTINAPLTGNPFEEEYIGDLVLKEISTGVVGETVKVKPDFDQIVLKFNNYIDDSTLGAVTFTGEGVENLQKTLSDNDKTLTISFDPLMDKEFYTLTIGTGLKSTNDKYLQEEITYTYQVDSDLTRLNITSHNTETNYPLLSNEKRIVIKFNFDLDPETVASGIKFTKADGTAIPGGYNVSMGESAKEAIITFGRLPIGEYNLVTTSALKALEEGISTKEAELSFVVETEEDEPVVSGNFSNFEEGDVSNTQLGKDNASFVNSTYEIATTENGTKYVTATGTKEKPGGSITITLPQPVSKGEIAFDLSFKAIGGKIKRNLFTARDSSNNKVYMLQIDQNNRISKNNETITVGGSFTDKSYTTDEDGFYNLRIVYRAEDEQSNWTINVYDKLTSMTEPIWKGEMGRVYDKTNGKYGLPNISNLVLFDIYWINGNPESGAGVAVKEYAYLVSPVPQVLSSNLDAAQPDTDEFELIVDSDLNEGILLQETVTLIAGEREIPADVIYDAQNRKLTITPKEYLEYDTSYEIKFGNLICENVTFETSQRPVSLSSNPVLVEEDGVKSVNISAIHNSGATPTICAVAKVFDAEGNLIKIVGNDTLSLNDELQLTDVTWQESYRVQTFIWAFQNGLLYPISSPVELIN